MKTTTKQVIRGIGEIATSAAFWAGVAILAVTSVIHLILTEYSDAINSLCFIALMLLIRYLTRENDRLRARNASLLQFIGILDQVIARSKARP